MPKMPPARPPAKDDAPPPARPHTYMTEQEIKELVSKDAAVWGACARCEHVTWIRVEFDPAAMYCAPCRFGVGSAIYLAQQKTILEHHPSCACVTCAATKQRVAAAGLEVAAVIEPLGMTPVASATGTYQAGSGKAHRVVDGIDQGPVATVAPIATVHRIDCDMGVDCSCGALDRAQTLTTCPLCGAALQLDADGDIVDHADRAGLICVAGGDTYAEAAAHAVRLAAAAACATARALITATVSGAVPSTTERAWCATHCERCASCMEHLKIALGG